MTPILPGARLGVLGGGQLGRMFAIAARRLGYRVLVLDPAADSPAGQIADETLLAPFDDTDAVAAFARRVDCVTLEFENVPESALAAAAAHAPVRPAPAALAITRHRAREKQFLAGCGLPVTPFAAAASARELAGAAERISGPAVIKTATLGYDGKGQRRVQGAASLSAAWRELGAGEVVVEALVDFRCELSMIGVRGADGAMVTYGPILNEHRDHILDLSTAPAGLPAPVQLEAERITAAVLKGLDYVGVLCVELFLEAGGALLVNELAPRPHNSGHLTIDAFACCQFEQQVRATCGLPLGSNRQLSPACMANLLGDRWRAGEPNWPAALAMEEVSLHLYGKAEPRPGRKMGHFTALGEDSAAARARALAAREALD